MERKRVLHYMSKTTLYGPLHQCQPVSLCDFDANSRIYIYIYLKSYSK
jgi:hypothetical protein